MNLSWRLGAPGWKIAALLGFGITIKIDACHDAEAGVYFAKSDNIGLAVEAETLDELMREIQAAVPVLIESLTVTRPRTRIILHENFAIA